MSDLLNIGSNALLAFQRALDTTGQNIANVNTDGYSRQRVELASRPPTPSRKDNVGNGVQVVGVERITDQFLVSESLTQESEFARQERFLSLAGRVDSLLSDPQTGLSDSLNRYFEAARGVEAEPGSSAARRSLNGSAEQLAGRFNSINQQYEGLNSEVNTRLGQLTTEVNQLSQKIAELNLRIPQAQAQAGLPPNDLLDQRDRLVAELATKIGVRAAPQDGGAINVYTANGQGLVVGRTVTQLTTQANSFDPSRQELAISRPGGAVVLSDHASGGEIGGLLDFRREMLDPARSQLGRIAVAVSETLNQQHRIGTDLYGNPGGDLFAAGAPLVLANSNNSSSASLTATVSDVGQLTSDNYELRFSGGSYSAINAQTGAAVSLSGSGTTADPLVLGGVSVTVSGTPADGDRFLLQPTTRAARDFSSVLADPSRIAAAAPVVTSANLSNTGNAQIDRGQVVDGSDANLRNTTTIRFVDASNYTLDGGATTAAYTSGDAIRVNGVDVRITGNPAAGDEFSIQAAGASSSDNGNIGALADLQTRGILDSGNVTIGGGYAALVSGTGSQTLQAQMQRDATEAFRAQVVAQRESISGVNLDEEAANLLKFQQSYQAAAQVISAANDMFQSLLGAVRR